MNEQSARQAPHSSTSYTRTIPQAPARKQPLRTLTALQELQLVFGHVPIADVPVALDILRRSYQRRVDGTPSRFELARRRRAG